MRNIIETQTDLIKRTCHNRKNMKLTIGVLSEGKTDIRVFGESGGRIADENYIYEIGSVTKTFTASLLAKHLAEGRLSLDDRISAYIPGLEDGNYYPTLRRLATHTSGYAARYPLGTWEFLMFTKDTFLGGPAQKINPLDMDDERMTELMKATGLTDRDYKWNYSNFGFALLGLAVGAVGGESYWQAMNRFVNAELGLKHTSLGTSAANLHGFSAGNEDCGNWLWNDRCMISPSSALSSTAADLLDYAALNLNGELPYLSLAHQKYSGAGKNHDMGLGWWLPKTEHKVISHTGGTGCFSTFLAVDQTKGAAVTVLSNYQLGLDSGKRIGNALLDLI